MGFTYREAYTLPLWQRRWFVERIQKEFKRASERGEQPNSRAAHDNDATSRALRGMSRSETPSRIRRFT